MVKLERSVVFLRSDASELNMWLDESCISTSDVRSFKEMHRATLYHWLIYDGDHADLQKPWNTE